MMIKPSVILALAAALLLSGCSKPAPKVNADTIFTGGDIVTMNDAQPSVEALAVKDGKILAVGTRLDIEKNHKSPDTTVVDLAGKTLLPGFIDPHSHYINSLSVANQVNVFSPPAGPATDAAAIVAELVKFRDSRRVPESELIIAYGYDESSMPDGRLLNRDDLDAAFPNQPVMVGHVSLHGAVLNSAAQKMFGYSAATKTPAGGIIVRKPGTNEPYGLIMETAFLPVFSALPSPTPAQEVEWTRAGQMLYAAAGITTAQEGATHAKDLALMQRATDAGANLIDIVALPFILDLDAILKDNPPATFGTYRNGLKLGGVKVTLDGSPQGRTAFFTTPYLVDGPNGEKGWRGELPFPQSQVDAWFRQVYDNNLQLVVHANGDAAIDVLLRAHEAAAAGSLDKDRRTTIIHSQFVRPDQLDAYVKYRFIPSFFTEHAFYFGETHVRQRGEEQAFFLSPMRAAIDKGLRPTNHTDFNVSPLDQMFVVWTAVNRVSRGGEVIGPDQRVTPLEALKAITINAAYQYSEEATKGSLEPGKLADLVILDRSPLTVPAMEIRDIKVVETLKEGKTIYRLEAQVPVVDQGLDAATLRQFHHTDQGTRIVPAAWLASIDRPDGSGRFMSADNLVPMGFLVDDSGTTDLNPYGWPIGFTVSNPAKGNGVAYAGLTCAACHTGQIEYQGAAVRIEGGQSMFEMERFLKGMVEAFGATASDPVRRERFFADAIKAGYPADRMEVDFNAARASLSRLSQTASGSGVTMVPTGRGRMDAVQGIANRVFGDDLMTPANKRNQDAPTSVPYLWDIWRLSWVQYNGFLPGDRSLARNIGEVMGLHGKTNFVDAKSGTPNPEPLRWQTSIQLEEILWLEEALHGLKAPAWPAQMLGAIDPAKARRGREHFTARCAGCHGIKELPDGTWDVAVVPLEKIGTDPKATTSWSAFTYDATKLGMSAQTPVYEGLPAAINEVRKALYAQAGTPANEQEGDVAFEAPCGYKARPLIGVWSTPPFLHNGSVRTIFDLLSESRPARFTFGSREYDPALLGYTEDASPGSMVLDTSIPGNSNAGHWFTDDKTRPGRIGPKLADDEKYEILEYLKAATYQDYPTEKREKPAMLACQGHKDWAANK